MPGDVPDFLARELDCSKTLFRNPARRLRPRRYYRIARGSKVDESLFGPSHREVHPDNRECYPQKQKAAEEWKQQRKKEWDKSQAKTMRVITKDLIRYMKHPESRFADQQSLIVSSYDFDRLVKAAHVVTAQDRQEASERALREIVRKQDEVEERKKAIKFKDLQRVKNERLNDLEEEEKAKAEVLLKKANEQRLEQEDEIKVLNELIMNAKIQTIRDHQLKEKEEMKKDLKDEDRRLDLEMDRDRVNAIRIQEEIERKRREEKLIGAMKIMEQIKENEQERLLDLERKDQENQMMLKYLDQLCEEEAELRERHRKDKIQLREELNQCNEDMLKRKELDAEQDKMIEENVQQFQKEKAEREAAYEREQERIRREKEAEVARLRLLQERALDEKAIKDTLMAKRAAEENERKWRKKEAMDAIHKKETDLMLKQSRLKQIEDKQHYEGLQAQREKADFQRVLRAQQELIEKEKRDIDLMKKRQKAFRDGITAQIREKEQAKMDERIAFFEEGVRLQREARLRRQKLEQVKERKLKELRGMGLPEKYLARIESKASQSLKPRLGNVY